MGVTYKDYYKTLGVSKTSSKDEIAKAYKKLARKYHPDLNAGDAASEEKFKEVTEAYEVLKDDEKRKMYDQLGSDWQQGQQFYNNQGGFGGTQFQFNGQTMNGAGFSDFFETLFGGGGGARQGRYSGDPFSGFSGRAQAGRDVEAEIRISLEDAVKGGEKEFSLAAAHGGQRTLKVNIPAGVHEGAKLRLSGQGYASPDGGAQGDLYLKIRFAPHSHFVVEGNDIIHEVMLDPWQAALGAKVRIPTLEGEVELSIPAGTSSGRKMRLRGKGLGKGASRGDELVRIGIRMPTSLTPRQRELWEALAGEAGK